MWAIDHTAVDYLCFVDTCCYIQILCLLWVLYLLVTEAAGCALALLRTLFVGKGKKLTCSEGWWPNLYLGLVNPAPGCSMLASAISYQHRLRCICIASCCFSHFSASFCEIFCNISHTILVESDMFICQNVPNCVVEMYWQLLLHIAWNLSALCCFSVIIIMRVVADFCGHEPGNRLDYLRYPVVIIVTYNVY